MSKFNSWNNPLWSWVAAVIFIADAEGFAYLAARFALPQGHHYMGLLLISLSMMLGWVSFMHVKQAWHLTKKN